MKYWHIRGNKDDLRCSLVSMLILYETCFNPPWIVPVRVTKLPTTFFMFTKVPSTYLDQWLALSINFPRDLILRHLLPDYYCLIVILAGLKKIVCRTKDFVIWRFVKSRFYCSIVRPLKESPSGERQGTYSLPASISGCSLGIGAWRILRLLCRILRLTRGSLWLFFIQTWSLIFIVASWCLLVFLWIGTQTSCLCHWVKNYLSHNILTTSLSPFELGFCLLLLLPFAFLFKFRADL